MLKRIATNWLLLVPLVPLLALGGLSVVAIAECPCHQTAAQTQVSATDAPEVIHHFKHQRGYKQAPAEQVKKWHEEAFKRHGYLMRQLAKSATPPGVFDAATMGWVQPVVDQGQCGDCFGVSSSDAVTGAFIKGGWGKNDGSFKISDQAGLDCGFYQGGCNGGDEAQVIDYYKTTGGPAEKYVDASGKQQSDYGPYTANPGRCNVAPGAKLWKLQDWGYVAGDQGQGPATLDEYKAALMAYGQLSIALDASSFDSYSGGVITSLGNSIDHAITCTGWDDGKKALHCRNNWGTGWGEGGYCWISYSTINQIVEPIWLLAPTVAPPPGPPPTTAPATATVTATIPAGSTITVTTSTGAAAGTITVTGQVAPGTYPAVATPPSASGTITFAAAEPAGTSLTFPGLGTLVLSVPVSAGETLTFSNVARKP